MTTTTAPDSQLLPAEIARSVISARAHATPQRLHDAYTWARQNNPLGRAQVDGYDPFWLVTKHADVAAIGRDSETFRSGDRPVVLAPIAGIDMVKAMTGGRHQLVLSLRSMVSRSAMSIAWATTSSLPRPDTIQPRRRSPPRCGRSVNFPNCYRA